mmetsp:Transcript_54924/g.91497  ORF Transcript_54924/g.91497 Transcript_54924/m.91497 type:complete len:272 (-) Transcript_54924:561-1376(-)
MVRFQLQFGHFCQDLMVDGAHVHVHHVLPDGRTKIPKIGQVEAVDLTAHGALGPDLFTANAHDLQAAAPRHRGQALLLVALAALQDAGHRGGRVDGVDEEVRVLEHTVPGSHFLGNKVLDVHLLGCVAVALQYRRQRFFQVVPGSDEACRLLASTLQSLHGQPTHGIRIRDTQLGIGTLREQLGDSLLYSSLIAVCKTWRFWQSKSMGWTYGDQDIRHFAFGQEHHPLFKATIVRQCGQEVVGLRRLLGFHVNIRKPSGRGEVLRVPSNHL